MPEQVCLYSAVTVIKDTATRSLSCSLTTSYYRMNLNPLLILLLFILDLDSVICIHSNNIKFKFTCPFHASKSMNKIGDENSALLKFQKSKDGYICIMVLSFQFSEFVTVLILPNSVTFNVIQDSPGSIKLTSCNPVSYCCNLEFWIITNQIRFVTTVKFFLQEESSMLVLIYSRSMKSLYSPVWNSDKGRVVLPQKCVGCFYMILDSFYLNFVQHSFLYILYFFFKWQFISPKKKANKIPK